MIYIFEINTEIVTFATDPKKTVLKLRRGVIHQLDVLFPPGSQALLRVGINRGLHQVWPTNPSGKYASDDDKITFHEHYELDRAPFQLEVYTYNLDEEHDHSVYIRIGLLPKKFVLRRLF